VGGLHQRCTSHGSERGTEIVPGQRWARVDQPIRRGLSLGSDDASVSTSRRAIADQHWVGGVPRVLVVGTDDWAIEQSADVLADGRCEVFRCHEPGDPAFPCNLLHPERGGCPLDRVDVVVDVRATAQPSPAPGEIGAICALRAGVPLVLAGLVAQNPFAGSEAAVVRPGHDLQEACADVAGRRAIDLRDAPLPLPIA
jgi:hypothetical protein